MGLYESVRAVTTASGDGPVDWTAVADAAKASTDPGSIALTEAEQTGYADDVRDARDRVRSVAAIEFDLPEAVEIQNRHHWIDANVATFRRVMRPLEEQVTMFPGASRVVNTGTMSVALAFLGNNVLGQYDPLLLAEGDDHALYFVHPNIEKVANDLDVDFERFRRWIAFHEIAHAAEFGAAPWLSDHLETTMEGAVEALGDGHLDRDALKELDTTMTAVEGYAELIMDRAFDDEYADLREKVEARRRGRGPVARVIRRLLGLGMKRRQYERGKAFFDAVADERGIEGASVVWDDPNNLPSDAELEDPALWLARVGE
ncbi:zinc-dependent metalloprotease [Halosimplex salinum]|uniref:zinc-dependent metalloprotease n=1 Tax=Halosimplex salinum TaxID=1710538 RepID=UPI000F47289D|nr:zinc-dependent metalloprotease [Halosimplex salinum]